jgi:hypothetical protein
MTAWFMIELFGSLVAVGWYFDFGSYLDEQRIDLPLEPNTHFASTANF